MMEQERHSRFTSSVPSQPLDADALSRDTLLHSFHSLVKIALHIMLLLLELCVRLNVLVAALNDLLAAYVSQNINIPLFG